MRTMRIHPRASLRRSNHAFTKLPSLGPPTSDAHTPAHLQRALDFLSPSSQRLLVLSGAGLSTHSGIPDYRSPSGSYSRGHKPMMHNEFVTSARARQRYWARSLAGYEYFSRARPNAGHAALAGLQGLGVVDSIITQNVDGLHDAAGSNDVLELHGSIEKVECLACGERSTRSALQERLRADNADWLRETRLLSTGLTEMRADGDSAISDAIISGLRVPCCASCGGTLKPSVVFFGGNVPAETTARALKAARTADALLIVGSTVQTFSAFRLVREVAGAGRPVCIVNLGATRADKLVPPDLRLPCDASTLLESLYIVGSGGDLQRRVESADS